MYIFANIYLLNDAAEIHFPAVFKQDPLWQARGI